MKKWRMLLTLDGGCGRIKRKKFKKGGGEMQACAFTGHRSIARGHTAPLTDLLDRAIGYAYEQGCRIFLCGGALGFDTLAARRVLKFRIEHPDVQLQLVLPCIDQSEHWSDAQRDAYDFLIQHSDTVRYVSETYTDTCMKERNAVLAGEADMLVAYVSRQNSGAAQTVRMAQRQGKPVYNLFPAAAGEKK